MNHSLWTDTVEMPEFPPLSGDLKTDILIVGGGLAGLLCAHKLHSLGADYALIEADRIMQHVSANTTAKITSQHGLIYDRMIREFDLDTARGYYQANAQAAEDLGRLARDIDCDYERKNNYIYATDGCDALLPELKALKQIGAPVVFHKKLSLPIPVSGALCFEDQAQFHPLKFAASIVRDLKIYEHTAAREFAPNRVMTDRGVITASHIIVATHFPILNKHGGYFLKMYQQRSYVMALENAGDVDGMYLDAAKNGFSFRSYGELLLLGGGGHRTGKQGSGWAELEQFRKVHYPKSREVCRWATQDCMTLDGVPYIGRYSQKVPGLYVATGFNKWGMTSSMVAAELLADLVQGKGSPYRNIFDPSRSILRPQLLINGAESVWNLLTPTAPRCPHLGCALKWNPQEHSWDCPCHGSRFAGDGKLLDNPATGDAKIQKSPSE